MTSGDKVMGLLLVLGLSVFCTLLAVTCCRAEDLGDKYITLSEKSYGLWDPKLAGTEASMAQAYIMRDIKNILAEIRDELKKKNEVRFGG